MLDELRVLESLRQTQSRLSALPRVTFANDSAVLTTQGKQVLADLAEILQANRR